ncbi:tumor necrosis factor ligand superfamily member 18-like protein [Pitangus sulphuratus]|nr:tumor necrosis factor ligand superfamily member 18-like protein [Pitangus sulphuratus]
MAMDTVAPSTPKQPVIQMFKPLLESDTQSCRAGEQFRWDYKDDCSNRSREETEEVMEKGGLGLCKRDTILIAVNTSSTQSPAIMRWNWKLEHCNGFVRKDGDQYLIIEHSGKYFIYAQLHRLEEMEKAFTLTLYKDPEIMLNRAGGPIKGDVMATVNFARPFFLKKGDRLYCKENVPSHKISLGNQTYWGLFKM